MSPRHGLDGVLGDGEGSSAGSSFFIRADFSSFFSLWACLAGRLSRLAPPFLFGRLARRAFFCCGLVGSGDLCAGFLFCGLVGSGGLLLLRLPF